MSDRVDEVLGYWFGELAGPEDLPRDRAEMWFAKNDATDYFIRQAFEGDVTAARRGELDGWKAAPRSSLAWILLLDQFTRNIYRGFPAAFESDLAAQIACLEGIDAGHDLRLHPVERLFYYLPLEHAEDLEVQERSLEEFTRLAADAPASLRTEFEGYLEYARRHHAVIERFGRFPHRNAILRRESTPEEEEFLRQPGSRF